jgi:hypothetical protein
LAALGGTLPYGGGWGGTGTDCIWIGPFKFGGGKGVVGTDPVTFSGFAGFGYGAGFGNEV